MSIFSRKNKASQSPAVNGKPNGQASPAGPNQNANTNGMPNGSPPDPIVQRMTIQAASRKRMNTETPNYSIVGVASSPAGPANDFDRVPSSPFSQERTGSQDSRASQPNAAASSGSAFAPIEVISPQKAMRETNKLRKSNSSLSPQYTQAPFPKGADPDTQKVRMPAYASGQPTPKILSRDSGYASVAPLTTVDSRTQNELSPPQESELLNRHRKINASLPRHDEAPRASTTDLANLTTTAKDVKARTAPTTPTSRDTENRNSALYVSRLDPGSASSSFLSSSVAPEIYKPRSSDSGTAVSASQGIPNSQETRPASEGSRGKRRDSSKRTEEGMRPTPNMSRPRESQPRPAKFEQLTQAVSQRSPEQIYSKSTDPTRPAPASPVLSKSPISSRQRDPERAVTPNRTVLSSAAVQAATAVQPITKTTQPTSASSTPFQTPQQSRATSFHKPSYSSSSGRTSNQPPTDAMGQNTSPSILPKETNTTATSAPSTRDEKDITIPEPSPSPKPQDEFPYLAGIGQGPTLPPVSVLEGFKVNRRGQILDEEGDIIGELTSGEIVQCVRRKVNGQGEIIDDSGNVVGHAVALPRSSGMDEDPQANFSNELVQSPMATMTPMLPTSTRDIASTLNRQTRYSQRANSVPERTINNADSAGNVVYIELDASTDSQALPLVDQSEIFIPGASSQPKSTDRSRSATNLQEIKRIAEGRKSTQSSHTSTASQEKIMLDERRNSKRYISQYYDARVGPRSSATNLSTESKDFEEKRKSTRPRSLSSVATGAPKAVLGPTWESLLDTVPDRSQSLAHHKSVIITPNRSETMPGAANGSIQPITGGSKVASGGMTARSRRTSQSTLNARNSTHQSFIKSPLGSVTNTPPDTVTGSAAATDESFRSQLDASSMGRTPTTSRPPQMSQVPEDDESAAPAPIVRKKETTPTKSTKRRSLFGIPLGRKRTVVAN